jgi:hypothetical protein
MSLGSLRVIHIPKGPQKDTGIGARLKDLLPNAFHLDSCQRWLTACLERDFDAVEIPAGAQVFAGSDAYRFLLRVATGLESQIVGETDIFGQLKEAWRKSSAGADLGVLMQRLFEDTKDIRSRFLQNLGGASYGSLVRMLLKHRPGPTLIVGAGQIAQSISPYLMDQELWLTNRSPESLVALYAELMSRQAESGAPRSTIRMVDKDEEPRAWLEAANVVVCIPFDESRDPQRVALLQQNPSCAVVHLGGHREAAGVWKNLTTLSTLDDLFALQKTQGDVRMTQIQQASRACDEKAKLRALGASVTIPHGWEDLAIFA